MKKYRTPEQLGMSFAEYGALLGVREMLDKGILTHDKTENGDGFNLNQWFIQHCSSTGKQCGTTSCIGGSMILITGDKDYDVSIYEPIHRLFYPHTVRTYSLVTPEHAVMAIDNFLTKGKPEWYKVVPKWLQYSTAELKKQERTRD